MTMNDKAQKSLNLAKARRLRGKDLTTWVKSGKGKPKKLYMHMGNISKRCLGRMQAEKSFQAFSETHAWKQQQLYHNDYLTHHMFPTVTVIKA